MKRLIGALVFLLPFTMNIQALEMEGDTVYFLLVDRFFNGDSSNNTGNNPLTYSADGSDWKKYFGGDIKSLINHLYYLENMGVSAIWITPAVNCR